MAKNTNVRSNDRVIALAPREGAKNVLGLVDPRLFTGENKLHAVMEDNGLWALHYDKGIAAEPLRQKFTSFPKAMKTIKEYYNKRNIDVKEVID